MLTLILLAYSAKAIQFGCNFQMQEVQVIGVRYRCGASVITNGSETLESVTGVHLAGKSHEDVGFLYIDEQIMPIIPEGIADFFKNLDALTIRKSSLRSISANDLKQFPRLLLLRLASNQLTSLDGDLFKYTPHLQVLNLRDNLIEHIGHHLLTNLKELTHLYLQSNICVNQDALNRADVLSLAPQLSVLCPTLDAKKSNATNTTESTPTREEL